MNPEDMTDADKKFLDAEMALGDDAEVLGVGVSEEADELSEEQAERLAALEAIEATLSATEEELGLEYVGPGRGANRKTRRQADRTLRRVTRNPDAVVGMEHPMMSTRPRWGAAEVRRRRARNKRAKQSRKRNRK